MAVGEAVSPKRRWRTVVVWISVITLLIVAVYLYYPVLAAETQQLDDIVAYWTPRLIIAGLILVITKMVVTVTKRVAGRAGDDERRFAIFTALGYLTWVVAFLLIVITFVQDLTAFAVSAGLIGFGITLALQRPILSFMGWIWITTRHLYRIGDRIRIGEVRGDVVEIDILTTSLWEFGSEWIKADQPSGRMISIPNSTVLEQPIYNYTRDFPYVWDEITVNVAQESDWKFAISLLEKIADEVIGNERMGALIEQYEREMAKTALKHKLSRKPAIHVASAESWLDLTVRYLVDVRQMRRTKTMFASRVMEEFAKHPDKLPPSYRRTQAQQIDETGWPIKREKL